MAHAHVHTHAQITVLYAARLRSSQLAPQPFNLVRRLVLLLFHLPTKLTSATSALITALGRLLTRRADGPQHAPPRPLWSSSGDGPSMPRTSERSEQSMAMAELSSAHTVSSKDRRRLQRLQRGQTRRGTVVLPLDDAEAPSAEGSSVDLPKTVERFLNRAVSEVKLFPEFIAEHCASQEYLIAEECGRDMWHHILERVNAMEAGEKEHTDEQRRRDRNLRDQMYNLQAHLVLLEGNQYGAEEGAEGGPAYAMPSHPPMLGMAGRAPSCTNVTRAGLLRRQSSGLRLTPGLSSRQASVESGISVTNSASASAAAAVRRVNRRPSVPAEPFLSPRD